MGKKKKYPHSFNSKVAGVTRKNPDGKDRQAIIKKHCKPRMSLILKRELDNQYDSHATGVWIKIRSLFSSSEAQIGYLNRSVAREVVDHIESGRTARAKISNLTGGTRSKKTRGVNIEITLG